MSQNSMVIPNTNGATFRTNLNNSLNTAVTNNSGASAPSSPTAGYTWYDTATDAMKARNAGNTAWYRLVDDTTAITISGVKTFSSSPVIPTPSSGDATTKAASTAFVAAAIPYNTHAATSKATPVDADEIGLIDSAASWVLKKLTWANLKATLFASPALTGTPTSTTPSVGDNTTKIATTAFVNQNRGLVLMTPVEILSVTTEGTHTSTVSSATFGGLTPSFVLYTAIAHGSNFTDLRYWTVSSGAVADYNNMVIGSTSDDTDQAGSGSLAVVSTFSLPYASAQQFTSVRSGGGTVNLKIKAIGYQL